MTDQYGPVTQRLVTAIRRGEIAAEAGYLVGLDRPALLAPDPAALLAAQRRDEILATGHRWRVVTESLWLDLLKLGRERPLQRIYVIPVATLEAWIESPDELAALDRDGWRGDQGTSFNLPILDDDADAQAG